MTFISIHTVHFSRTHPTNSFHTAQTLLLKYRNFFEPRLKVHWEFSSRWQRKCQRWQSFFKSAGIGVINVSYREFNWISYSSLHRIIPLQTHNVYVQTFKLLDLFVFSFLLGNFLFYSLYNTMISSFNRLTAHRYD